MTGETAPRKKSLLSRVTPKQWLALVLTILAVVFILANRNRVEIQFLLVTVTSPMWLILLIMFLAGMAAGWLFRRSRR